MKPAHTTDQAHDHSHPTFSVSHAFTRSVLGVVVSAVVLAGGATLFGRVSDQRAFALANPPNSSVFWYAGVVDKRGHLGMPSQLAAATMHAGVSIGMTRRGVISPMPGPVV